MKKVIITLLAQGFTRTKKDISDLKKSLYFIDRIAKYDDQTGMIRCNGNRFWSHGNNENRVRLIQDISRMTKSMLRGSRFSILNEYENGNAYGIEKGI